MSLFYQCQYQKSFNDRKGTGTSPVGQLLDVLWQLLILQFLGFKVMGRGPEQRARAAFNSFQDKATRFTVARIVRSMYLGGFPVGPMAKTPRSSRKAPKFDP